jgi:putative transposase
MEGKMTKRVGTNQIVKILNIYKQGLKSADEISREYGISRSTLYKWKNKYEGMSVAELNRLKQLEDENRRLKAMYADLSLVYEAFKDAVAKKL